MRFDAGTLDAIERIMTELAAEHGRRATTAQVLERAQAEGVTTSTGTVQRYKTEIERRRRPPADLPGGAIGEDGALPMLGKLDGHVAELRGAIDGFASKITADLEAAAATERRHFAQTLSQQHGAFQRELAAAVATIADLEQTLDAVIAEGETSKAAQVAAVASADAARTELDQLRLVLIDKTDQLHALEVNVARLESEERRHRDVALTLSISKSAMTAEIAELKKERTDLRAKLDDVDPLRFALHEWQQYVGRGREVKDVTDLMRPKVSLEKK